MNAVCTIAAKNYLPQAYTLGDSLKKNCPDLDFYILLSDEGDASFDPATAKYTVIEARNLGIPGFKEMAFKYDVVEFCTSVKPFLIEYFFNNYGYDKIVYLDPDMYVYGPMTEVFDILDKDFVVLTPHILKPYTVYSGVISEEELLFVGIYNLGFAAFRDCAETRQVLAWWQAKLKDQGYADKEDALHVDQRWMDFLPALYEHGVHILRNPAYNLSHWNMHERSFTDTGNGYMVDDTFPLTVFHFSGFDPHEYEKICRKQSRFTLHTMPEYRRLFEEYTAVLLANGYDEMSGYNNRYRYGYFDNGIIIMKYQRRLYRALLGDGYRVEDPFAVGPATLFELFEKSGLVIHENNVNYNTLRKTVQGYDKKVKALLLLMKCLKKLIGIKYYYMLMRFLGYYTRFEKQLLLVER